MVLLVIVFVGWVRMNNIQAVNKESLRYAAIEKAAGMLDAVASVKNAKTLRPGAYLRSKKTDRSRKLEDERERYRWKKSCLSLPSLLPLDINAMSNKAL